MLRQCDVMSGHVKRVLGEKEVVPEIHRRILFLMESLHMILTAISLFEISILSSL